MSDSERDIHRPAGDLATPTPPERSGDEAPGRGRSEPVLEDPYAHHAFVPEEEPKRRRRGRRAKREAAPPAEPPADTPDFDFELDDRYAPVVPITEGSMLHDDTGPRNVRIRKLRVVGVLFGLSILAVVSTVFGMLMAITSDLPQLETPKGKNSVLTDRNGKSLGMLTGNQKRIFVNSNEIAPVMKQAIISIEDRRFYTNAGIDIRGIGRALWSDVRAKQAVQGGSTITMQFVKNALAAQDERTLFNKLREAALAYQITRKWSKERILKNYLNSIYFGNGAYGIESAARTYFGSNHPGCGEDGHPKCAQVLDPAEAAMIAGIVASPTGYDPLAHREAAAKRRALVLLRMREQGYITPQQEVEARETSLPTRKDVQPPVEDTQYPYFTSWVKQQVVDKLGGGQEGARKAFEGGLTVQTTLDVRLQEAAEQAVQSWLPYQGGPRASLVAIDNKTSEVLAMVGGDDYSQRPFNLATQGQRQPGSTFKPFALAQALSDGVSPESTWSSRQIDLCVARTKSGRCKEAYEVNNYEDAYGGIRTLRTATTYSDNSVYAQLGQKVGTRKIARTARRMGIRTPVSHNLAMPLGGLEEGVTPLDMAHAYETIAQGGRFTYSTMSPGYVDRHKLGVPTPGPAGIRVIGRKDKDDDKIKPIELPDGSKAQGKPVSWPVLKSSVAGDMTSMLSSVVAQGTGTRAQIPGAFVAGKTGTTENYGDAWFVGWTHEITVAVWVGYPDGLRPMETEFNGQPVAGGTYPAAIWKSFMETALGFDEYSDTDEQDPNQPAVPTPDAPETPGTTATVAPTPAPDDTEPSGDGDGGAGGGDGTEPDAGEDVTAPETPAEQQPPAEQAPAGGVAAPG
jgi:penicillin-binding protein 1A